MPEYLREVQEGAGLALLLQDFVLISVRHIHSDFARIRLEALDEALPLARGSELEAMRVLGEEDRRGGSCHAIPFPVQDPDPRPSGAGAGWAIGVALP